MKSLFYFLLPHPNLSHHLHSITAPPLAETVLTLLSCPFLSVCTGGGGRLQYMSSIQLWQLSVCASSLQQLHWLFNTAYTTKSSSLSWNPCTARPLPAYSVLSFPVHPCPSALHSSLQALLHGWQGFQCCWPTAQECEASGSEPVHICCFFKGATANTSL